MSRSNLPGRALKLALFLGVAYAGSQLTHPAAEVGASPLGRRSPFEIVVVLESPDLPRPFEYTQGLTRRQYDDVRFDPRRPRDKAIKAARKALAKKLGYDKAAFQGRGTRIEQARVRDVLLIDVARENRRDGRVSILRQRSVL